MLKKMLGHNHDHRYNYVYHPQTLVQSDHRQNEWELLWDTDVCTDFNFHDYSRPYHEMAPQSRPVLPVAEDLTDFDWLLDFKVEDFLKEKDILSGPDTEGFSSKMKIPEMKQIPIHHKYFPVQTLPFFISEPEVSPTFLEEERGTDSIWKTCVNTDRPPFNYNELVEQALIDKGKLTVDGIYQWIADRFPYFKMTDSTWKACIRQRLCLNRAFVKKEKVGKCHLWSYQVPTTQVHPPEPPMKHIKNHWKKQKLAELEIERKKSENKENVRRKPKAKGQRSQEAKEFKQRTLKDINNSKKWKPSRATSKREPNYPKTPETLRGVDDRHQLQTPSPLLSKLLQSPAYRYDPCEAESPVIDGLFEVGENSPELSGAIGPFDGSSCGKGNLARDKLSVPKVKDVPSVPMQMDINSCRVLSMNALPPSTSAIMDADSTFLNPVSFREVIVESGLLDDPPSTRTMSFIPKPQFQVPAEEADNAQLFGGEIFLLN